MAESARSSGLSFGYRPFGGRSAKPASTALILAAGVSGLVSISMLGMYFASLRRAGRGGEAVIASLESSASDGDQRMTREAAEKFLDESVVLSFDSKSFQTTWRELGLVVDEDAVARTAGRKGLKVKPVALNREKGLERLVAYKDAYDRPAVDARIDLEHRQVIPDKTGFGIHVYESLALVEETARTGKNAIELTGGVIEPSVTRTQLGDIDVSHVMGWFETRFPMVEKDRNYNLKVAAEKLNGYILMPHQEFSFNAIVGDRTEKEGYRVAHVITAGEMVDGLAGGTCQISTTLHGASWFAGLEILHSLPHSRPSAYVTMGLDATVVYPTTDLKLRNPYDFPVVIRYVVAQGVARVEILGQKRPYDKVEFEREVKKEIPYDTITREDDTLPVGSTIVEQIGFPGYELVRRRNFYQKKGNRLVKVKKEERDIKYPPTVEYIRVGTNPDPNIPMPKQPPLHGPKPPGKDPIYKFSQ